MNDKDFYKELQLRTGQQTIQALADSLNDVLRKDPSLAIAATVDVMRALDALLSHHNNADRDTIDISCATFITALTNASTLGTAKLVQCNPNEQIIDYTGPDDYLIV